MEKSEIVDSILNWAQSKQTAELKRKGGCKRAKLSGIPKLDDANNAGTSKVCNGRRHSVRTAVTIVLRCQSKDCTLILTEGDSAKALAISGLGVVGRDYYGVFPLKVSQRWSVDK